jgi:predicted kinase
MARLIMICGLPGSGKTTLAKRLEVERPALRLTPDEWIAPLYGERFYGEGVPQEQIDAVHDRVEAIQWTVATQALSLGVDVVLDFGFWTRSERESFRARARALGAESEIIALETPIEELVDRIEKRNRNLPLHTFHISEQQIRAWWEIYEPPQADELEVRSGGSKRD